MDSLEGKVVKKRRSSMTVPRSLASPSFLLSGSSSQSPVEHLDANYWSSSDLRALMDPLEVAIGATIPFEGDGTHPPVLVALAVAAKKAGIDCLGNPAFGAPNMHLEGEGESSPFPCLLGVLHLSQGWNFPPLRWESWLLPACFI